MGIGATIVVKKKVKRSASRKKKLQVMSFQENVDNFVKTFSQLFQIVIRKAN